MQIYLARNNQQAGPYTLEQVNAMLANTQVVLTDLAWHEGMSTWLPLGQLTGGKLLYIPSNKPTTPTVPVGLGTQPSSIQYSEAGTAPNKVLANGAKLAGIGQRIGAGLIDFMILYMTTQIMFSTSMSVETINAIQAKYVVMTQSFFADSKHDFGALAHEVFALLPASTLRVVLFTALIVTLIQIILIATRGQTLGKMILNIKIVDEVTLEKTTFFRSVLLRSVLVKYLGYYFISILLFVIDFGFLFSKKNRTVHDRLAKTLVIKVTPTPYEKPKV